MLSKTTETKILNRAKWYYKNNKDWLREQTRNSLSDSILYSFFRFLSDINYIFPLEEISFIWLPVG